MVECTNETISIEFQLGHVSSDMDRKAKREVHDANYRFQLGHFLAEMDRGHEELTDMEGQAVSIGPRLLSHG